MSRSSLKAWQAISACILLAMGLTLPAQQYRALATVSKEPIDPGTSREVMMDLPRHQMLRNLPNGGGCCVWASIDMMSRWQNFTPMIGVLNDKLGPANADDVVKAFKRRAPGFQGYVQATGPKSVPLIDWAMKTGRIAAVTYGYGERYGQNIRHMVIVVHLDPEGTPNARACVMDNNFPGSYEWMPRNEFIRRHQLMGAWTVVLLPPPPPPVPVLK